MTTITNNNYNNINDNHSNNSKMFSDKKSSSLKITLVMLRL